jgi:prepilin-type N-terminal cleavage/methylation domain-containing protein
LAVAVRRLQPTKKEVSMSAISSLSRRSFRPGFTLIEVLVVITVLAIMIAIMIPALSKARRAAKNTLCKSNLRQFAIADVNYLVDHKRFPTDFDATVPSSTKVEHLQLIAKYLDTWVPQGAAVTWPSRKLQPKWVNCPFAVDSEKADGLTVGGGRYTGYMYVAGIEKSWMARNSYITIQNSKHSANFRNDFRGVLWADIVSEFITTDPRRYEFFHFDPRNETNALIYTANELEGFNRAWSDGSVEWVQGTRVNLLGYGSPDLQIVHFFGNYYY